MQTKTPTAQEILRCTTPLKIGGIMIFTPVYKLGPLSVELFCYIYVIGRHMLCEDCGYVTYSVAGDGTQHKQMHTVSPTVLYWLCPTPPPPPTNVQSHLLLCISIHSPPSVPKYQEINTVQFFPFKSTGTPGS